MEHVRVRKRFGFLRPAGAMALVLAFAVTTACGGGGVAGPEGANLQGEARLLEGTGSVDEGARFTFGRALACMVEGEEDEARRELALLQCEVVESSPDGVCVIGFEVADDLSDEEKRRQTLERIAQIDGASCWAYAEPNYRRYVRKTPNDSRYDEQWHYPLINLEKAWDVTDRRQRCHRRGARHRRDAAPGHGGATHQRIRLQLRSQHHYAWFSRHGNEPVRFNLAVGYESFDDERIGCVIHVSIRWPLGDDERSVIRLDVVDGEVDPSLPAFTHLGSNAPTQGAHITVKEVHPDEWTMHFPAQADVYRLTWTRHRPPTPWIPIVLGTLALLTSIVAARMAWQHRSTSSTPPDITAEAAHEMRTPLTAMRGGLEVTLRRPALRG